MSLYEWLLFLHLLGAVAIVAAVVTFGAGLVAVRRAEPEAAGALRNLARIGSVLFDVGGIVVLVFGIWLAFEAPSDYGILDAWILAAIAFWVVAAAAGGQARNAFLRSPAAADVTARRASVLFAVAVLAVLAMLVLMIFKPGAG